MNITKKTFQGMSLAAIISAMMPVSVFAAMQPANNFILVPEFSMDSGDYGGGDTIKTYSLSVTGTYEFSRNWSLSLTVVPYLHQNETYTDVVLVAGKPVHHADSTGGHSHHDDTYVPSQGHPGDYVPNPSHPGDYVPNPSHLDNYVPNPAHPNVQVPNLSQSNVHVPNTPQTGGHVPDTSQSGNNVSQSGHSAGNISRTTVPGDVVAHEVRHHGSANGVGDAFVNLSYMLMEEDTAMPGVSIHAGIKLPTADEDKGLGTGKFDYQAGMALSKELGRWFLEGGIDYNILGDPDEYDLDNYVSGYTSVSTRVIDNLEIALQLSAAQAASDFSDDALSMGLRLNYFLEQAGTFTAGLQKGLTDGSPDYSIIVGYSITF